MRVHSGYPNLCKLKNKLLDKSHVPRVQWRLCEQRCFRLWRVLPTQICWMWETQYASWSNPASSWALLPTGILVGRVAVVFFFVNFFAWMMCRELHHFFRRYLISMLLLFLLLLMLLLLFLMLEKDRLMISASPFYALLVADCFKCNAVTGAKRSTSAVFFLSPKSRNVDSAIYCSVLDWSVLGTLRLSD